MDRITYCADIEALKAELVAKGYYNAETESFDTTWNYTPIKYNGVQSLSLVRGDMPAMDSLEVLGTYEEIFADPIKDAKYKSVYPYDVPVEYTDEDGVVQTFMRPQKIGEFA